MRLPEVATVTSAGSCLMLNCRMPTNTRNGRTVTSRPVPRLRRSAARSASLREYGM